MAGSPSLGVNLSYDPFAAVRTAKREPLPANYGTGLSPDGLSYSVIDDFDKIASQAYEEYQARLKNPRTDVWGKVLPEDQPENLKATILEPAMQLINGGVQSTSPLRTYKTPGGGVVGVDAVSGRSHMLVPDAPAKTPEMSYAEKQKIAAAYRDRTALMHKPGYEQTDDDKKRLAEVNSEIAKLEAPSSAAPAVSAAPQAPPFWASWPQQGNVIGTPATNTFSGVAAPFVPVTNAAPQKPIKVLSIKRK
jgi:hypothetical protein